MSTPQDQASATNQGGQTPAGQNTGAASTMTLTPSSSNPSPISTPFSNTLSQPFSLKLDRNNFPLWKTMVNTIIRGHRLDGFINGNRPAPPEFIRTGEPNVDAPGSGMDINPEYETWLVHDQLLMGWLYGSMTEAIASEVMGCQSALALWNALEELYGAHSRANMDELRTKIQTTRKGSQSMAEYLKMKRMWADSLALAGEPYPERHLVSNVLSGLDVEYLSIVVLIESQESTSWQQLQSMLLSFDGRLERLNTISASSKLVGNASANFAQKPGSSNTAGQRRFGSNQNQGRGQQQQYTGYTRGGSQRGRGRGRSNGPKPTCQVCGKYGHSAAICYNRYDESYMGNQPNTTGGQDKQFSALVATPEMINDDSWYADSGASNHLAGRCKQSAKQDVI
uniref:Retrotransposon Copia-like N-terminal domain-containing protein n=1 Tax=Cannabis sativa TaxID=3483 RepID=A0A803R2Q2_CANSA